MNCQLRKPNKNEQKEKVVLHFIIVPYATEWQFIFKMTGVVNEEKIGFLILIMNSSFTSHCIDYIFEKIL